MQKIGFCLMLVSAVTLGALAWSQRQTSCQRPLLYRVGEIDGRFTLGNWAFREVIERAATAWEDAAGVNLFEYDADAPFTISLIFDQRQQATMDQEELDERLKETERDLHRLSQSYERQRQTYDSKLTAYKRALAAYSQQVNAFNAEVQRWNQQGGAPQHVHTRLTRQQADIDNLKTRLENEKAELEQMASRLASLHKRGERMSDAYNQDVNTFNSRYGKRRRFNQGEYTGDSISIYQFEAVDDLTLVIAHELGHALGIGHVKDARAVMHHLMGEQTIDNLTLTADDIAALNAACGL